MPLHRIMPHHLRRSGYNSIRSVGKLLNWCLHVCTFAASESEVKGKPGGNPEPGDRLRFVFVFVSCVACVRAGEAKLRVRARCRVFLLGRPRLWEVLLRSSRPLCEAQDVVYTWVLKQNGSKSDARDAHCVCFTLFYDESSQNLCVVHTLQEESH